MAKEMSQEQKDELVDKVTQWWTDIDRDSSDERDRDKLNRQFYRGGEDGQWDGTIKASLESENKPVLTINHILPTIGFLIGTESLGPKDIKIIHRKGGYEGIARVLTELVRHAMDNDEGQDVKHDCFATGVKGLVGWLKISIDKTEDPFTGDLRIEAPSARDVYVDPTCAMYDLNHRTKGAKYIIERIWQERDWLLERYPDSAENLKSEASERGIVTDESAADTLTSSLIGEDEIDDEGQSLLRSKYRYEVHETWWYKPEPRTFVRNLETGDIQIIDVSSEAGEVKVGVFAKSSDKHQIKEKVPCQVLQKTTTVDKVLLEHVSDPFGGLWVLPYFQFVPFYEDGHRLGVIDNLISPQMELNKRRSQSLHLINQTANAGWKVRSLDPAYEHILKEFGSQPGVVIDESKCGGSAERLQPNDLSNGLVTLGELAKDDIPEISGVNTASRGLEDTTEKAAIHFEGRRRTGLVVTEPVFRNFDKTVRLFGRAMIDLIRRTNVYDRIEIMRIVDEKSLIDPQHLKEAQQELMAKNPPPERPDDLLLQAPDEQRQAVIMQAYMEQMAKYEATITEEATEMAKREVFRQLRDWTSGKYGVILTQSPSTPSLRAERLSQLRLISESTGPLPASVMIRQTSLPTEVQDEIIEEIEKAQGAGVAA